MEIWGSSLHREVTHLSSNSARIVPAESDHDIHVGQPELVIQALRSVYDFVHNTPIEQLREINGVLQGER